MGVIDKIRSLGQAAGVEFSEEDLAELGLADDGDEGVEDAPEIADVLSETLPGRASGQVELFLAADSTAKVKATTFEGSNLMWYPIIREGQWAVRPGSSGKKRRVPLQVVGGKSKNQRKQIGLQDLLDAYEDQAIQHVTVPTSHNNSVLENTGFIAGMKIVDGTVTDPKTKKDKTVKVLMGGYDIKVPAVRKLMELGTIANRSAGILYDYVNTETGKLYAAVIEHVALTNSPWITGMASFGRKLKEGTADPLVPQTVALSLSDSGPDTHEFALMLSEEAQIEETELDFLADESADWSREDSPNWLRARVNEILDDARRKKRDAKRSALPKGSYLEYEDQPYYRCVDAAAGVDPKVLISDGYSDDANHWSVSVTVKDGAVDLPAFTEWKAVRKAFINDDRPAPATDKLPLDQSEQTEAAEGPSKTRLQLAQEGRRQRFSGAGSDNPKNPREVVEHDMAEETGTLQLSAEARKIIEEAEQRAREAEERATKLSQQVSRLTGTVNGNEVDAFIKHVASDEGLGLSEARGFGGALAELRNQLIEDDHEPIISSSNFSEDGKTEVELSLSDSYRRFFGAIETALKGKKSLGELLSQPADPENPGDGEETPDDKGEGGEAPAPTTAGKPGAGDEGTKLSTDQKVEKIVGTNSALASVIGGARRSTSQGVK